KSTSHGRVLLAIHFKHLWFKKCIIKEASRPSRFNSGIDRCQRLQWEFTLLTKFSTTLPLPKPIDFFELEGKVYLVVKYVSGATLQDTIDQLYGDYTFKLLTSINKQKLIDYLLQAIEIIKLFHGLGYVHRDISASNFIVARNGALTLLDLELATQVSRKNNEPFFPGCTKGYSSPQQIRNESPTIYDDIYSIGCLIINSLTHMHPRTLDLHNLKKVVKILASHIVYPDMLDLIIHCIDPNPAKRPALKTISDRLLQYKASSHEG
ncbi:MAG TPA: protein kinase, partial [Ohtaekwangia sp.]|uniref:protein kinase domain-containing protein n=1 Tax=Ohtaekwangia sp. TaxID=2066019 RepID=UPI002F958B1B